ncbi:MAG: hypothetical protein RLZZ252_143 [Bacteroidota bacterium]|jgi:hypothetical protein
MFSILSSFRDYIFDYISLPNNYLRTMKKIPLFIFCMLLAMVIVNKANAQCTPDKNITVPGFYPATFPDADQDKPYSATTTILSIKDTTVFGQAVIIDSTVLKAVIGLPPGITHQCLNNSCVFFPSQPSCVNFSGTPTKAGTYPLKMVITIFAKIGGALPYNRVDTIRNFTMKVNGMNSVDFTSATATFDIMPNPVNDKLFVNMIDNNSVKNTTVMDATGRRVDVIIENQDDTHLVIDTRLLTPGIYFCSNGTSVKRFVKI